MFCRALLVGWVLVAATSLGLAEPPKPTVEPLVRVVDLNLGESADVELCNGTVVEVKLLDLKETRDDVRNAVRSATVRIQIDGREVRLSSANYELPKTVGPVRVDCPITRGPVESSSSSPWGLDKDVRLRFWPAGSPAVRPDSFVYPVKQRWLASASQMANEPCYVNACERPSVRKIYYHYGLDFGGCEAMTEVVAATDGLVVSARDDRIAGYDDTPVNPRYDVVYILDDRGWYYRYSHFHTIDKSIRPGLKVRAGRRLGVVGKEGGSGGWTHLHFDIAARQPSGKWGCQEAYAFAWEAYRRPYDPPLVAVARPHRLIFAGDSVEVDATKSWSRDGRVERVAWTFTDGTTATGAKAVREYRRPGYFSEIVRITDNSGRVDYDFAIVHVLDRAKPEPVPPTIHAVYEPTFGIAAGDEVTFKARAFGTTDGEETWDFGDGSAPGKTRSDGNVDSHAKDGYARITHQYEKSGHYLVRVERTDEQGRRAVAHVHVRVQ